MSKIYKILTHTEWEAANKLGYVKTDLDNKDGFVHWSTAKQLALTLHLYFKEEKSAYKPVNSLQIILHFKCLKRLFFC